MTAQAEQTEQTGHAAHTEQTAHRTTSLWARDESVPLIDHTVGSLLADRARSHADVTAVIGNRHGSGEQARLTYAELYDEAQRVATALVALTDPGDFVALWAPNVVEWPVIQYGAALAGVVLVALNPVLRDNELSYALTHSGARVLIHADASRTYEMAPVARAVAPGCPDLDTVISLSETDRWRAGSADPDIAARLPTDPDSPVMLQYTSGTTGNPKGVLLRNRSLVNVAKITLEVVGTRPGAVAVNPLPMFHTAGCVISTLGPLWIGGTVALIEQFDPDRVLDTMRRERASVLFYVPAVLSALLAVQHASDQPAPQLQTIMGGAANVPASLIEDAERTFGATVINLYGQTELAPVLTATRPDDARERQLTTVGRPLPQAECARGYQAMIGYLHDPQATATAIDPDGWVHTGDLGRMDAEGYVSITGRLKDMIIRNGENISPAEIEAVLVSHPDVAEAAVVGVPHPDLGEEVVAVVRLAADPRPGLTDELVAACRASLSPHKIPSRWYRTDALPVTPTGKVQKFRVVASLGQASPL
jgi:fatty-acyl-CoA synthase/long-chain acyl-CoA synthetase